MAQLKIKLPDGREIVVDEADERLPAIKDKIRGMSDEDRKSVVIEKMELRTPAKPTQSPSPQQAPDKQPGLMSRIGSGVAEYGRDVGRGFSALAQGNPQAWNMMGDQAETFVRSATAPLGLEYASAGIESLENLAKGQPAQYKKELGEQRARREALQAEAPAQKFLGEALGFTNLAALGKKGLQVASKRGPGFLKGAAKRVDDALTLDKSPTAATNVARTAKNVAKIGTGAGITTMAGELIKGEGVGEAAETGAYAAVITPLFGGTLRLGAQGAGNVAGATKRALGGTPSNVAMKALRQRMGGEVTDDALRASISEFSKANGRAPRVAEILDPRTIDRLKLLSKGRQEATDTLNAAEIVAAQRRGGEIAEAVAEGPMDRMNVRNLEEARDAAFSKAFRRSIDGAPSIADTQVPGKPIKAILDEFPEAVEALGRRESRRLLNAVDPDEAEPLTMDMLDNIRKSLMKAAGTTKDPNLREAAKAVRATMEETSPDYADALNAFKITSDDIRGMERTTGILGKSDKDFVDPETGLSRVPEEQMTGAQAGVKSDIGTSAKASGSGAVKTARELEGSENLQNIIKSTLGPEQALKLRTIGRTQAKGAENLSRLSPRVELPAQLADAAQELTEAASVATGTGVGAAFGARVVGDIAGRIRNLGVPNVAAAKMAQMITDPNQTAEVVERLARLDASEAAIDQAVRDITRIISRPLASPAEEEL